MGAQVETQGFVYEAPPITHLFTAVYEGGESFTQPSDDQPKSPRPDGTGSAYTDVDTDRVIVFMVESGTSDSDPDKHLYTVDLRDGHFEIDGTKFHIGGHGPVPAGYRRRLVYSRTVAHDQTSMVGTGKVVGRQTRRCYRIGFELIGGEGQSHGRHTIEFGHEIFIH